MSVPVTPLRRVPHGVVGTLLTVLMLAGCASSGGGELDANRNLITQEQIAELGVNTAYEVVERLRPRWLRVRASRSHNRPTQVVVLVDHMQLEGIEALRDVDARNVATIRWLDSAQAGQLPGLGSRHVEGAIVIETL